MGRDLDSGKIKHSWMVCTRPHHFFHQRLLYLNLLVVHIFAMPSSISNSPRKVGKPRLDKYERLLHRLYEAMVLLWLEQPVQGPHLVIHHDGSVAACRRRLSRNLAYICDYRKGGKTTTSIGIEDSTSSYVFWVATNDPGNQGRLMDFLRSILHRLRDISRVSDPNHSWRDGQEDACAQECTKFAARRIKKEARILSNTVEKCLEHLEKPSHDEKDITKRGECLSQTTAPNLTINQTYFN